MKNENFRVSEREELRKRRNMMRRLVDQNYRRCQKRERRMRSESEKVAESLPANKKRINANKRQQTPEANTFSRGKVMVNL